MSAIYPECEQRLHNCKAYHGGDCTILERTYFPEYKCPFYKVKKGDKPIDNGMPTVEQIYFSGEKPKKAQEKKPYKKPVLRRCRNAEV